jgi:asparagine synthetase B (glutamine-hydrolysing)
MGIRSVELLGARLREAVRRSGAQGCCLSGGLDSATLLAFLSIDGPTTGWTIADDFADDGELDRARRMAAHAGARHEVIRVKDAQLPDHAEAAMRASPEPIVNGRAIAAWLFYREAARRGATILACGTGADEIFAGDTAKLAPGPDGEPAWARAVREENVIVAELRDADPRSPRRFDTIEESERAMIETVLPQVTLPVETRMSEAHGVAVCFPYLDQELANIALSLPVAARAGKVLLRAIAEGLVPDEIRLRPKSARYAPAGGATPATRARWLAFYDAWLAAERVGPIGFVPHRVRALLDEYRRLQAGPRRDLLDRVLLRVASRSVRASRKNA